MEAARVAVSRIRRTDRSDWRVVVVGLLAVLAAGVPAESLEIALEDHSGDCRSARLVAVPTAPGEEPSVAAVNAVEWEVDVPGHLVVDLDTASGWTISVECPGTWAQEVRLEPRPEESAIRFALLPAGRLGGRLEPATHLPEAGVAIELRLQPVRSEDGAGWRSARLACALDRDRFDCAVPAGELDVRLAAEGFAPHYAWGLRIPAGETLDLGGLELIEGASVAGWVTASGPRDRGAGEVSILVAVEPLVQGVAAGGERRRLELRGDRTTADERGFFQLTGLAPGTYQLAASLPGHSPATISPIALGRGEEQVIERPLALDPLVTLEAFLDPVHDVAGLPWRIRLLRQEGGDAGATVSKEVASRQATSAGYWSVEDLAAGPYLLRVEDAAGSIWSEIPLEVTPGLVPLAIELAAVAVEGEVLLGEEPVAAEVVFGTTTRTPSVRMKSDEEGRFEGVLPHEGEWPLEIALSGRPPQALDPVEVSRGAGGVAQVILRLPGTRLAGEVVGEGGEPAAGVSVLVLREAAKASAAEREVGVEHRKRREASATTDRDGRFEIDGLLPARLHVSAHDATRASEWLRVELAEETPTDSVRLVLRERTKVTGVVVSSDGPVPGAAIVGFSRGRAAPLDPFAQARSGPDGRFTVEVTAGTELLDLLVVPPGHDVVLRRISLSSRPLAIEVARTDGRLVLQMFGPGTTVFHAGAELPLDALASLLFPLGRIELDGRGELAIAGLEPGTYAACPEDRSAGCASGHLAHGAELVLRGPDAAPKEGTP